MDNIIFLSAQPHDKYFQWQIEVQITNFRKFGISQYMHVVIWYPKHTKEFRNWYNLTQKYPEVKFFLYPDQGVQLGLYISQLRPNILKRHFKDQNNLLKGKNIFYHDSDIIFNYLPDFESLTQDNIIWQSDTSSYLDYSYLSRKEEQGKIPDNEAIRRLSEIGGIHIDTIKAYDGKTGGAQMLLKGDLDYDFWEDIENQCLEIRRSFLYNISGSFNQRYFPDEKTGFQSWCADMWAINFALWKRGYETNITNKLDFSWATDSIETYHKKPIFHNAGANGTQEGVFHKGSYIHKSPFNDPDLPYDTTKASSKYVEAIRDVNNV